MLNYFRFARFVIPNIDSEYSAPTSLFTSSHGCSVNGCPTQPPSAAFFSDARPSAFHFPIPPPAHPSLLSLAPPPFHLHCRPTVLQPDYDLAAITRSNCHVTNDVSERSSPIVERPPKIEPNTSGYDEDDSYQSTDRNEPPTSDVIKPRPRIWSLADVAMSTTTHPRRRTNDDVTVRPKTPPIHTSAAQESPGGRGVGTSGVAAMGGVLSTFQPWTYDTATSSSPSAPRHCNVGRPLTPAGHRVKVGSADRGVGDLGDFQRLDQRSCSAGLKSIIFCLLT